MKKVVFIVTHINPNKGYQDIQMLRAFSTLGFSVVLYAPSNCKDNFAAIFQLDNNKYLFESINVIFYKEFYILGKVIPFGLFKYLRQDNPDIIWVQDFYISLYFVKKYVIQNLGIKVYFAGHSDFSNSANVYATRYLYYPFFVRFILTLYGDCVDLFLPVNPSSGDFLSNFLGVDKQRIRIFPLSLDVNYYESLRLKERSFYREKLEINTNDVVIVTGGQLYFAKQTHDLIESFNLLNDARTHLLIFGEFVDRSYELYLKNLIGVNSRIKYLGFLPNEEVNKVMAASDIAVFPSSQTVLWQRSLALSLALVVGRYVNYSKNFQEQDVDYLVGDNCGLILNAKESKVEEIKNALILLLSSEKKLDFYKKNGYKRANAFLDIYKNITELIK